MVHTPNTLAATPPQKTLSNRTQKKKEEKVLDKPKKIEKNSKQFRSTTAVIEEKLRAKWKGKK